MTGREIPKIGKTVPRQDALSKVTGQEKYAVDYYARDFLWAGVKRAGVPHGLVKKIETEKAQALPGVIKVLTYKDVPGTNRQGVVRKDQPVLVKEKVRHCGDPIALVLAQDIETLRRALDLVTLCYEPLPAVLDPEEALKESAPIVQEENPQGNILLKGNLETGNVDLAFKECDAIVEASFKFPHQEHAYLETEGGYAILKEDGILEMTVSTQTPFRDRSEVAEALGWDQEKIRIIVPYCGGAFGGKDGVSVQTLLGLAAIQCPNRPVKMWWDREESFLASSKRHPCRLHYRLGAKFDGTFHALAASIYYDTGPYDHLGGVVMALGLEHAGGPYQIPNVRLQAWSVYTNNPIGGAFRGFGVPQVTAAMEQMVDMVAEKINLSPLEIRLRNRVKKGGKNSLGMNLTGSVGLEECLIKVREHPFWTEKEKWKSLAGPFRKRGVGVASVMQGMGYGPIVPDYGNAKIELTEEGRFRIYSGVVDMGQGNATTCLQIAGHILNQDSSHLELVLPDTARTLPSGSASASRTTYTFGNALIEASQKLKHRLLERAAGLFMAEEMEEIELRPGRIKHVPTGKEIFLPDLAKILDESETVATHTFQAPVAKEFPTEDQALKLHGIPHTIFSYGAHLACVEVDELTGEVEVKRYLAVSDCGKVINPQILEQQIQGGIAQGLGYALYEDFIVQGGKAQTRNLSTYIVPTSLDVPDLESIPVEIGEPSGPFGLKGAGEIAMDGPLPAIANAIADACGIRIFRSPMTPQRVFKALKEKEEGNS
ncbi:MAG: xanthine dehydrogenase family protein molybdopterin-binding subunit [Syntrophaceae bacterium]|nr:xanthine dehydrogenase family protein molybdopterin-binding subunit [Syntrophaceae bacterium]